MKSERFIFLPLLCLLLLTSCSKEGAFNQSSDGLPLKISSRTVTDYTSTDLTLLITGTLLDNLESLDKLQFYKDESCSGTITGQSLVTDFKANGIEISLPINVASGIYLSTEASTDCVFLETYTHSTLEPKTPTFSQTVPTSPTRSTMTPGIFGDAYPAAGTIDFYDDNTCTNLIGQGSSADYNSIGVVITVTPNVTTPVHAIARDQNAGASACTYLTDYEYSDQLSGPPQLISVSHTSPNNQSFTPTIVGSTAVGTISVALYSDPGCLNELASGDPADFSSTGFQITSTANSTIAIYAKSVDDQAQPSVCALLTSYTHDDIDPGAPSFSLISPISPTNATTQPSITGTSTVDTETLVFYDSAVCLNSIGSGTKAEFESTGATAGVQTNDTTSIYAKSFDPAGNDSACTFFTDYIHNTFPPGAPLFGSTSPTSPTNGSTTPFVTGTAAARTVGLIMYDDENCTNQVGAGDTATYEGAGIQITVPGNTASSIYVTVSDFEGNVSVCNFHAVYDHSTATAPSPGFFATFPTSPSNASTTPTVIGTADSSIETVSLYDDALCTNLLGSGTRGQFASSGVLITVPSNSTNSIYAQALDEYGNNSNCVLLTQYIHNTVPPLDPTFGTVFPLSPNNNSTTPTLTGTANDNPASQLPADEISFYDSPSCISKLGDGSPAAYAGAGVSINVPQNAESFIYARSFDEAGNGSSCVHLLNYTHNNLAPGAPNFLSITPGTPSYSPDVLIAGNFQSSPDFMNRVSMMFYSDSGCSTQIATANPSSYEAGGVNISLPEDVTTTVYAVSVNEVGTLSACSSLTTFRHYDEPPQSLNLLANTDGSVNLSWNPDVVSSPSPTYTVERSTISGGPFSVIATDQVSNTFKDILVSDNTTYYYRVFASNITGRSRYSSEETILISAPPAVTVNNLSASPGDSRITLSWSGFPQNMVYKVEKSTSFGGPFVDVGVSLTNTVYVDGSLTNGQDYYYIVKGSNPSGDTVQSNIASAVPKTTSGAPTSFQFIPVASLDTCGGAGGAIASWTAPSYFETFELVRDIVKSSTNSIAITTSISSDRCSIPGNTLYYYRVASTWDSNRSPYSSIIGFYTRSAPAFNVDPGDGEVLLSWTHPGLHADLTGLTRRYDIYTSDDYSGDYTLLVNGSTGTSYTDTLVNGQGKYYYIQAYVIDGGGDKVFVGYPSQIQGVSADADPAAPTNLTARFIGGFLQLDWTAPTHYNNFNVYSASSLGGPYSLASSPNSPLLPSASLITGMNYFKVRTVWGSFESADSNIVSFREATITGLSTTPGASDISLNWDNIAGVLDYEVFRATDLNGVYASIGTPITSDYTDASAVSGVGYYYKVKARFADLTEGQLSNEVKAMRTDSSTPSGISLTVQATSLIRVEWPAVSGAISYTISRSPTLGGTYVDRVTTPSLTGNLSGLSPNTEYFVKVRARVGVTDFESAAVSAWTYASPTAPSGTPGNNEIDVSWSPLAGVTDYDLLRSVDGVAYSTLVSSYPSTTYLDTSAVNGNIYFYKVQANYPVENLLSIGSLGITPGTMPLTPSQLSAENNGTGTEIELSWAAVSGSTSYNIYLSTSSGSYGVPTRSSTSPYNVRLTSLTAGTTYYSVVTALNGTLETPVSNEVSFVPELEPAAPTAVYSSASDVQITWSAIPGASTYDLFRSENGFDFDLVISGLVATSHLDGTVDPSKTYYYKYKSYTVSSAEMSFSQVSIAVNISEEPQVPLGFYLSATGTGSVDIFWSQVPSVNGYQILRGASSGGPYTLITSPAALDVSYTDSSVVPGTKYFYVMRSLSTSGVPSPDSVEKSIDLVVGPATLTAVNGVSTVDLSWSSVAGAVSYNLLRSLVSGGTYGIVTNTATLAYSDTDIVADKTYYYVVEAVFADGSTSVRSAEESILRTGYLSLQAVIELTDGGLSSSLASDFDFERTQTSFDTNNYDGVTSYELEIVATNIDATPRSVFLIDDADSVVGSVTVPAATTNSTRLRAVVTPNVGLDVYRLRLEQTTSDGELSVYSAKLLVNQVGATKTRLYFPLLSTDQSPINQDALAFSYSTSSTTYQDFPTSLMYERVAAKLRKIVDYNAWSLEVVVATDGISEGILGLQNLDTTNIVSMTETRFVSNTLSLATIPFDEGLADFNTSNENDKYAIRMKCEFECASGSVRLYKAGLWVQLENLAAARIINRATPYNGFVNSVNDFTDTRAYYDSSVYSSPKLYYQAVAEEDGFGAGNIELIYSNQDSGTAGITALPASNMLIDDGVVSLYLSPQITVPTGNNVMTRLIPSSGDLHLRDASLVIEVGN